ncbi:MAG: lytic murein transglycosylase B [Chromatiales bacterium]|nr:lytic murein transglycosylase B [Chromatiales bacterium]
MTILNLTTINSRLPARLLAGPLACLLLVPALHARSLDTDKDDVVNFVSEMQEKHGLDPELVKSTLAQAEIKQGILDAISKPAERALKWFEYRPIFVTEKRISQGHDFWNANHDLVTRIGNEYGVAPEALVAIVGVETYYGRITGSHRVLDALSTLAFEYPPRSKFFRSQLEEFFVLSGESGVDLLSATGSYAGAMGSPQFIPSSFRSFAVDEDGDGRIDLWENWNDVLASVANYFKAHGWRQGEDVAARATRKGKSIPGSRELGLKTTVGALRAAGWKFDTSLGEDAPAMAIKLQGVNGPEYWVGFNNFHVITRYNHSVMYALAVHQLSQEIVHRIKLPE